MLVHACNNALVPSRVFKGLCEVAKHIQDGDRSGSTGLANRPVSGIQERLPVCMQSLKLFSRLVYILITSYNEINAQRGGSNEHTCPYTYRHCHLYDVNLVLPFSRRPLCQKAQKYILRKIICEASAGKGKLTTDIFFNPLKEVRELFDGELTIENCLRY